MRNIQKLCLVISILFSASAVFGSTLEETFKKRIPAGDIEIISLKNVNGSVKVYGWDNEDVEITAYKKVRASSSEKARRMMENLEIEIIETADGLEIETNLPQRRNKNGGFFSWLFNMSGSSASVSYEIHVPSSIDLDLSSTNGSVFVNECSGLIRLHTTNGKVTGEQLKGAVQCNTTNGSIEIEMLKTDPEEEMSLRTTNGSVRLYLPRSADVDVKAKTTNGSIRCELPIDKSYSRSRKRLEGSINDGGPLIYIKTTNGSIKILEL